MTDKIDVTLEEKDDIIHVGKLNTNRKEGPIQN